MSTTQQPEALRLARKFEEVGFMGDHRFAKDHWCRQAAVELRRQHARIADLEAPLSAIAHTAEGVPAQVVELEVDDLIDRLLNAQQDLNLAANVHMDQSIASASTLLDEVEIALRTLAATQPAAQGMEKDAARYRWLRRNVGVYRTDDGKGPVSTYLLCQTPAKDPTAEEPDSAIDAALAAQAKQGD